jgi:hypothetical protein
MCIVLDKIGEKSMTYSANEQRQNPTWTPVLESRLSTSLAQHSTFNIQHSTFNFSPHDVNASPRQTAAMTAMPCSRTFSMLYRRSAPRSVLSRQPIPFIPKHPSQCYRRYQHQYRQSYGARMRGVWNSTRSKWYSIPVAAGVGFLAGRQLYKTTARLEEDEDEHPPKRRKRIRPSGPW